jgi:hypothetical protein
MFVVPLDDIYISGSKLAGKTYAELLAVLPSTHYLVSIVETGTGSFITKIAELIESQADFTKLAGLLSFGIKRKVEYYRLNKDYFPDYFQLADFPPKPNKARSTFYLPYSVHPDATAKSPAILAQDFGTPNVYWDEDAGRWSRPDGSQYAVEMKIATDVLPGLILYMRVASTLTTKITNTTFVNLNLKSTIAIPLSSNLLVAQFACTDGSVSWDETDLPLIDAKSVSEIMAAPLKSKIAVIGDRSQTFEQFGIKQPGPYIFRSGDSAIQIVRDGGFFDTVYRVFPMMLQPLWATTPTITNRTIYTTSTALVPQNGDTIIVDGVGNINLPLGPIDGFKFALDDRKYRRLNIGRNAIVPATGETIGVGQTAATIDHLTPLTWGIEDAGSFSQWIYEAAAKNWVVLLTREVAGTAITQSAQKPLIYTTNADIVAQPYDRLYLNGTGNILLTQIVAEREFIDIEWSVGATWIMKVICPVGFTIAGVFEDLDINTALTSVTHLRLALKAGNDFGVSA